MNIYEVSKFLDKVDSIFGGSHRHATEQKWCYVLKDYTEQDAILALGRYRKRYKSKPSLNEFRKYLKRTHERPKFLNGERVYRCHYCKDTGLLHVQSATGRLIVTRCQCDKGKQEGIVEQLQQEGYKWDSQYNQFIPGPQDWPPPGAEPVEDFLF